MRSAVFTFAVDGNVQTGNEAVSESAKDFSHFAGGFSNFPEDFSHFAKGFPHFAEDFPHSAGAFSLSDVAVLLNADP